MEGLSSVLKKSVTIPHLTLDNLKENLDAERVKMTDLRELERIAKNINPSDKDNNNIYCTLWEIRRSETSRRATQKCKNNKMERDIRNLEKRKEILHKEKNDLEYEIWYYSSALSMGGYYP
ncbi:hypothetical protein LOD99_5690 [Oopsacas minuta]|uniref:BZIP domain-containing protein n=1 Tax=Oopsacas minuta TaxID=111878 RepID=A0AAV7JPL8_9METZ|nr:hypothetical protein LOD99_5690 [Oopsacas minuta]